MLTIHIQDEQLAQRLQEIAEREGRSLEDVLRAWVAADEAGIAQPSAAPDTSDDEPSEAVRRVRRKFYAKARRYWEAVGDAAKAALTDAELDEQFAWFDEEDIPRLKSELTSLEPPLGSAAYAAKSALEADIHTGNPITDADDVLNEEFADYLLNRMRGDDVAE